MYLAVLSPPREESFDLAVPAQETKKKKKDKTQQDKTQQNKAREGKAKQGKGRKEKGREAKRTQDNIRVLSSGW